MTSSTKQCWVEAGVSTYPANESDNCNPGHDSTCGFWADQRPNPGGYHEHPLYNFGADGVDLSPYYMYVGIGNEGSNQSSGSSWSIGMAIYDSGTGSLIADPGGLSTSNQMNVDDITIGSELSDSNGSAGSFYFEYNQWMDGNGNFHYQTTAGNNPSTSPPPAGRWDITPCNCPENAGGTFLTYDS